MAPPSFYGDDMSKKVKDAEVLKRFKKKVRRRNKPPPLNHQKKLGPKDR